MTKLREYEVEVRTNCEYVFTTKVKATSEAEAHEAAMVAAKCTPMDQWEQSWADMEAETV